VNIIPHRCLHHLESLAEGGFGTVYVAEHEHWGTVAYKELKTNNIIPEKQSVIRRTTLIAVLPHVHNFSMNCTGYLSILELPKIVMLLTAVVSTLSIYFKLAG